MGALVVCGRYSHSFRIANLVDHVFSLTEAARSGEVEVIKYLIDDHDVDVNERTNGGYGGSPLFWAEHALHPDHEAIALLRRRGAVAIPPEPMN